jgi:hypothetical protein
MTVADGLPASCSVRWTQLGKDALSTIGQCRWFTKAISGTSVFAPAGDGETLLKRRGKVRHDLDFARWMPISSRKAFCTAGPMLALRGM